MQHIPGVCTGALAPLGIRTVFEADDPRLLEAALAAYQAWRDTPAEDDPPVRIRLHLVPGEASEEAPAIRVSEPRLVLSGRSIQGAADASAREGRCTVPATLLDDPDRLAAQVLDTLVLFLLTRAGRVPVHAAGIVLGRTAVVLAGPSGTGKSTLALTARDAGLPVLSDDTVYIQLTPRLRVWGFPRPIHLLPDAPSGEPGVMRMRGGRWKRALPLPLDVAPFADQAALVLLERGTRVAMERVDAEAAVRTLVPAVEPGFDDFRAQLPTVLRAVAAGGAWRLTLSADPAEALRLIRETLGE